VRDSPTRRQDESGSAIVEFALVVPLLFALLFGMFSGGLAYNRKLALTNGVREGSRYGATLAVAQARTQSSPACTLVSDLDCWLTQLATVTQQAAEGELGSSVNARQVCIAYVYPNGAAPQDGNRRLMRTATGDAFVSGATATCFADSRPAGERRVQVSGQRDGRLELLVTSTALTLRSRSVTRFEAAAS